jgi:hypothetical protein
MVSADATKVRSKTENQAHVSQVATVGEVDCGTYAARHSSINFAGPLRSIF